MHLLITLELLLYSFLVTASTINSLKFIFNAPIAAFTMSRPLSSSNPET